MTADCRIALPAAPMMTADEIYRPAAAAPVLTADCRSGRARTVWHGLGCDETLS